MPKVELIPYHKDLAGILKSEGNPVFRRNFLSSERLTAEYQNAKEAAKRRNLALKEIARQTLTITEDGSSQGSPITDNPLIDIRPAEGELTPQEQTILWANQVLEEYNSMPRGNSRERRAARNLATQTARYLIENPQDIDSAGSVWKSRETKEEEQDGEKQKIQSFYDLVKQEASRDIRENWGSVSPEQLTQLVKTYTHGVLTQDFAHDLLASYFKGTDRYPVK